MESNSKLADTLNELALFINDRVEGYKTAARESKDVDLQNYYQGLVQQSQLYVNELNGFAREAGGSAESATTFKGKFYRGFMDAKALLTARNEQSILDSNLYGEEWALKAYRDALDNADLSGPARAAVERQFQTSQATYERLKQLKGTAV